MLDFSFEQDTGAGIKCADGVYSGSVLVTKGQVKQKVLGAMDAQLIQ